MCLKKWILEKLCSEDDFANHVPDFNDMVVIRGLVGTGVGAWGLGDHASLTVPGTTMFYK